MPRIILTLLVLGVWIYAFIDCLNTPEDKVRNLPKLIWVAIIVLFGSVLFGPIAWFLAGRQRGAEARAGGEGSRGPRRNRNGWVAPDDNPDFLRSLKDEDPKPEEDGGPEGGKRP